MEHTVHHLPLLIAGLSGLAALQHSHEIFPFLLARQGGQFGHGLVPIEIDGRLNDHEQSVAQDVNLHLEDAARTDTLAYDGPKLLLAMSLAIALNQLGVIFQIHGLAITLHRTMILLLLVSFCHIYGMVSVCKDTQ